MIALLPERSPPFAEQLASLRVAMVRVTVEVGLTLTLIGDEEPLNASPFDKVPLHGPVPVTAIERVTEPPTQIVPEPLKAPVGRAFTETIADPERSPPVAVQLASSKDAIV